MRKVVILSITFFILLASAAYVCFKEPNKPVQVRENIEEILISETKKDFNRDGKEESLVVKMAEGKYYEDTDLSPLSGWKWEGKFIIELRAENGKVLSGFDLSKVFPDEVLVFKDKFAVEFEDYNEDGCEDFTIGQYATSNGYVYHFFSIQKDNRVELLAFEKGTGIFNDNNGYSARFDKVGGKAFITRYYDNTQGKKVENRYKWVNDKFVPVIND